MSLIAVSIKQISIMSLLIIVGIICYRTRLVNSEQNKTLSTLALKVVNPMVIFQSYQITLTSSIFFNLMWAFLLSFLSFVLSLIIAPVFIKKNSNPNYTLESLCVIYSNCGFIGIPLISAVLGDIGVLYLTSYLTLSSLFLWTHGYLTISEEKFSLRNFIHTLCTPCLVAVYAGIISLIINIQIPDFGMEAIHSIGNMNTPLAMLVAGITIAQTDLFAALKNKRIYFITATKLILIPLIIIIFFIPFARYGIDKTILMTVCIAASCPTSATCTMFAVCYNKNEKYSSELFAVTTLLSAFSIPLIVFILGVF